MSLNVLDVSNWQASAPASVLNQSQEILIVKATEGTNYVNPSMKKQVDTARAAGKLVGLYHFAQYGDSDAQAKYFYEKTKDYWGKGWAIPILDWENSSVSPAIVSYPDFGIAWLEKAKQLTGATPWVYANASVANAMDKRFHKYSLWVAAYAYDRKQNGFTPQVSYSWVQGLLGNWGGAVIGWQHTQYGYLPGYASNLDMNVFFADRKELESYAKGSPSSTVPAPKPIPKMGFPFPENTRITQNFGDNATQYNSGAGHSGTDFAVPVGTAIKSPLNGIVWHADWASNLPRTNWYDRLFFAGGGFGGLSADAGILVVLDHGDFYTAYAHLNETKLNDGDKVKAGDIIGKSGNTGSSTGPHCHVELIPKPVNFADQNYFGRVDFIKFRNTYNAKAATTQDWFDMATEKDLENVIERVLSKERKRKGAGQQGNTSITGVIQWFDYHMSQQNKKLDAIKNQLQIVWGGIFTEFSYSGKPGTNEPGIIRLLKAEAGKVAELEKKLDALGVVAANGGEISNKTVSAVTGISEERLIEILGQVRLGVEK